MLTHKLYTTVQVALMFVPSLMAQLAGDPVWDYCYGDGSICAAAGDLLDECAEESGADYYECMCTNGYIPTNERCQWCLDAGNMNGFLSDNLANQCEAEGHDIAPIPSSIISQQEERNETTSMPEVTYTPTYTYTTPSISAWTVTLIGEPDVTLPTIASAPTETGAASTLGGKGSYVWQGVVGLAAAIVAM